MFQISNSLQGIRHFCFDANPYAIGRRGLRRNRNVCGATPSDLSHFEVESTQPNNSPEPPLIACSGPPSRLTDVAARLSFCR
jgi:hypothetical protein